MAPKNKKNRPSVSGSNESVSGSNETHQHSGVHAFIMNHLLKDLKLKGKWILEGVLSPVIKQGECNCCTHCVAAAVVAATYIIEFRKKHPEKKIDTPKLAFQELIDCIDCSTAKIDGTGCRFLSLKHVYDYISDFGVHLESNYGPYTERRGECKCPSEGKQDQRGKGKGKGKGKGRPPKGEKMYITGYKVIEKYEDPTEMLKEMPLSAIIAATPELDVHGYTNKQVVYLPPKDLPEVILREDGRKVMFREKPVELHAVIVVDWGYNEDGTKYYLIQNSWGTGWGLRGFLMVHEDSLCEFGYPTGAQFL